MHTWPPLHLVGITHRKAGLDLRERFALARAEIVTLLTGEDGPRRRGVALSTCNRFEVYWYGEHDWPAWFRETAARRGAPLSPSSMIRRDGHEAARHLFRVAAGLDAQVVGETEVLGQVRRAWALARDLGASCRELDVVFSSATGAGRRIRREATLDHRPTSIGSVAVAVAARENGGLNGRSVLLIGAGEAALGVAEALDGTGAKVTVISRHMERSAALAREYPVTIEPWEKLDGLLGASDVAFAVTAARESILPADRMSRARSASAAPLLLVDLGVPRNVEPAVRELPGIRVLDLNDLPTGVSAPGSEGVLALDVAHRIVEEEVSTCIGRLRALAAGERLAGMHRGGDRIAEQEVSRLLAECRDLPEGAQDAIRRMANRLVRRVLFPAGRALREVPTLDEVMEQPDREPEGPERAG